MCVFALSVRGPEPVLVDTTALDRSGRVTPSRPRMHATLRYATLMRNTSAKLIQWTRMSGGDYYNVRMLTKMLFRSSAGSFL
eukprot:6009435-Pleurochrysis_carterae.AAC.3